MTARLTHKFLLGKIAGPHKRRTTRGYIKAAPRRGNQLSIYKNENLGETKGEMRFSASHAAEAMHHALAWPCLRAK